MTTTQTEFPREFVADDARLNSWSEIEGYFTALENEAVDSGEAVLGWLLRQSELASCIDEVGTDRYVRMTCQTDDDARKRAYLEFVEEIEPKCKPRWYELDRRYVEMIARFGPMERLAVLDRSVRNQLELFREENIPLEVEEARYQQKYQELIGAMMVTYDGRELTLPQLGVFLESPDRGVRQEVWELSVRRRMQDGDAIEDIFDELFKLRHAMAGNANLPDYRALAFKKRERFDYNADDCLAFHKAIEETCVPLVRTLHETRRKSLGVETLRPWDLSVDVKNRPSLKPFEDVDELVSKCRTIFDRLDPELGRMFQAMSDGGELDLDSRKGKAPGGYQSTYHESRRPFIFMNSVGLQRDVRTLIHEAGHAFHAVFCRNEPLIHYRSSPIEFAEVASMGMEMLAYEHFDVFYEGEELRRAKRQQLEGIVTLFPWVATIDAFQHWMYTHPGHTRDERCEAWMGLHERFGGLEDYAGYEDVPLRSWQRQLHLFEVPFYYVEYGIAQLGALQLWRHSREDLSKALAGYRSALSLGGSRPLPELFAAAGLKFDFSSETLGPLMDLVQSELELLAD